MFRKVNGPKIHDVKKYVTDYIKKYPDVLIYIGTDSKRKKKSVLYISTICFRHPNNGVHVIYRQRKYNSAEYRDIFKKLWHEVELSVELLGELCFLDRSKITVDLDFSVIEKYKSNAVNDGARGWLTGLGVNVRSKPNAWAASYAADYLSNK